MSLATDTTAGTPKERTDAAIRRICQALGLGDLLARQLSEFSAVLVEVASEEIARNPTFQARVKAAFDRTLEQTTRSVQPVRQVRASIPKLTPIRYVDPSRFATYGPSDPYALLEQYGHQQLPLVLSKFLITDLKKSAALVQEQNPGAQLRPKAKKSEVIDFIVQYVND